MPTGVAIRDPREQLFSAAERILLRDGPSALTSRAVTDEAGVAKGVLHRHFADFDDFLAQFVLDRVERMDRQTEMLRHLAGFGTVAGNLTSALTGLFGSAAVAIVPLVISREGLRTRLRESWPAGVPVITQAAEIIADYLRAERDLGRVAADADVDTLAVMLIATTQMEFTAKDGAELAAEAVDRIVAAVLSGARSERVRQIKERLSDQAPANREAPGPGLRQGYPGLPPPSGDKSHIRGISPG
jgi:AcrR family transcriptional regulator